MRYSARHSAGLRIPSAEITNTGNGHAEPERIGSVGRDACTERIGHHRRSAPQSTAAGGDRPRSRSPAR